jgi:hypothetical protein
LVNTITAAGAAGFSNGIADICRGAALAATLLLPPNTTLYMLVGQTSAGGGGTFVLSGDGTVLGVGGGGGSWSLTGVSGTCDASLTSTAGQTSGSGAAGGMGGNGGAGDAGSASGGAGLYGDGGGGQAGGCPAAQAALHGGTGACPTDGQPGGFGGGRRIGGGGGFSGGGGYLGLTGSTGGGGGGASLCGSGYALSCALSYNTGTGYVSIEASAAPSPPPPSSPPMPPPSPPPPPLAPPPPDSVCIAPSQHFYPAALGPSQTLTNFGAGGGTGGTWVGTQPGGGIAAVAVSSSDGGYPGWAPPAAWYLMGSNYNIVVHRLWHRHLRRRVLHLRAVAQARHARGQRPGV